MAFYTPLVSKEFNVPEQYRTDQFLIRPLTIDDLEQDYDAVMTSIDHLQGAFGEKSKWPSKDLTKKQDLIDLGWHQKEFQMRSSFAYAVTSPDSKEYIGCVYIFSND